MIKNEKEKYFSLVIIGIFFIGFTYIIIQAFMIVQKRQISTDNGIYANRVSLSDDIQKEAYRLTKECKTNLCKAQKLLDSVTAIPYITSHFQSHSPKRTLEIKEGDCDDKSNLLISLLHAVDIKAYFVLVPKHIFVIVDLDDKQLEDTKALWLDGKPYYILESTAKESLVGYRLKYRLDQIEMILDPFINKEIDVGKLEWR